MFYEKHMVTEVAAEGLCEDWKQRYVVWISGENDKQGFPTKHGIQTHMAEWACGWVRAGLVINQG
jgi:ribosomal protein S6E (S10)